MLLTAVCILVISNRNSFIVLFDEIASVYFIWKYIKILALEMASPGNQHYFRSLFCNLFVCLQIFPRQLCRVASLKKLFFLQL